MTTTQDAPVDTRRPPLSRRLPRWLVPVVLVVLLASGIGLEKWAGDYQPLVPGDTGNFGSARIEQSVGSNREVWHLPFAPGKMQRLQFSVRNAGRFAITVDSVPLDGPEMFFGIRSAAAINLSVRGIGSRARFPYRLAPGQELLVEVNYEMQACEVSPSATTSVDGLPVDWHAFGRHHRTEVPVPIVAAATPDRVPAQFTKPCPPLPQPTNN